MSSSLDQKHACRSTVSAEELDRGADQLVLTRDDPGKVETFDDHDVRTEQGLVHRIPGFLRTLRLDREIVDADDLHPVLNAPSGRARVDRREVAGELRVLIAPTRAVRRLEEDPLRSRRQLRAIKPLAGDVARSVERDNRAWTDQRVEGELVGGVAAFKKVN